MGAAQGDLAGREIIEQGSCALHLCKVEVDCVSGGRRLLRLSGMTGEFHDFLFCPAMGG